MTRYNPGSRVATIFIVSFMMLMCSFFFQMHRHLGCDIYLITQDVRCLARELQQLAEYVIKAVRGSNSIGKSFTYKFYSGDECFKTKRIKQDQKVFGMYRSMIIGEGEDY
ncbi:zonular occludens toxin domain-containing protein [Candidatus Scalindua japonica]|nr:zonular occludens toxin domain-containing protein [Candidatus Scalindua japonica]